jgi:phospholipase C
VHGWVAVVGHAAGSLWLRPAPALLLISPFARKNYVAHGVADQSSILRFIEDNWNLGRIGGGSFDAIAGSLLNMFDFAHPREETLFLDPATGGPLAADREERAD